MKAKTLLEKCRETTRNKQVVTSITVTRLGYQDEASGTNIPDDIFSLSGDFDFLTEADREEFLDELRQTFELISPFGCTVGVTGVRFEKGPPQSEADQ